MIWTDEGPRSTRYDDIYYASDGLAEAREVFLAGCGLPEAWAGRRRFTVAELGFGTGLNMLALIELWRRSGPRDGRLHLFSVEAHPLSPAQAERALTAFPELGDLTRRLLPIWPGRTRGFERLELPELGVTLDVATLEAAEALAEWTGAADAWFLDGFAPSRNPEMWRPEVLDGVVARSAPGARLATFTVAGAVRRALAERGFELVRAPGHGRKKERLEGRLGGTVVEPSLPRVAIVGGGIAGAALARGFGRLGAPVVLLDPDPGSGASGNPAALVSPRLDAGGGAAARLGAQAFARAVALYRGETPEAVIAQGALKLLGGAKDPGRFDTLAQSDLFRPGGLAALGAAQASTMLGEPSEGGLWMADALTLSPAEVIRRWLDGVEVVRREAAVLDRTAAGWRLAGADGVTVAEAEVVCLAPGAGLARWRGEIEAVRGQASWTEGTALAGAAASWGGYAAPLRGGGVLFGATHERGCASAQTEPEADRRNLDTLRARMPELAARVAAAGALLGRAGVRAATPDRLPMAGMAEPGLFVLGGLGGRGFSLAPLLAEHVAAEALGAPSPLPLSSVALLAPDRFERRAARRRVP